MEDGKRACIAIIAASIHNKRNYSSVFDYSQSSYIPVSVNFTNNGYVSAYDYHRGGYLTGNIPNLFDYVSSSHINLLFQNSQITGFDFGTSSHFSIQVTNNHVSVFDHNCGCWFYYSVS